MDIKKLQNIVGTDYVITDRDHMQSYLCDETVVTVRPKPAENVVVVKPGNSREISEILKLANQDKNTGLHPRRRHRPLRRRHSHQRRNAHFDGKTQQGCRNGC